MTKKPRITTCLLNLLVIIVTTTGFVLLSIKVTNYPVVETITSTTIRTTNVTAATTVGSSLSSSQPVLLTEPYRNSYKQYQSKDEFLYLHRSSTFAGLNNQLECIHIAANLALRYNRTLLLKHHAFQGDKQFSRKLPFDQVFGKKIDELPIRVQLLKDTADFQDRASPYYKCIDHRVEKEYDPDDPCQHTAPLGGNESSYREVANETCVTFACSWAHLHLSAPPNKFPYIDQNILPLNDQYIRIADRMLADMMSPPKPKLVDQQTPLVLSSSSLGTAGSLITAVTPSPASIRNNTILGLHVRGGDNPGYPAINCTDTTSYPYTVSKKYLNRGRKWGVFCSKLSAEEEDDKTDSGNHESGEKNSILTWERYLEHLGSCDGTIPDCIDDYDAVYIATNDVMFEKSNIQNILNSTKVFYLQDFEYVDEELHCLTQDYAPVNVAELNQTKSTGRKKSRETSLHPLHYFLLEETILMRVNKFQPSVPSSVSDIVFHYRQDLGSSDDAAMYEEWTKMIQQLLLSSRSEKRQ